MINLEDLKMLVTFKNEGTLSGAAEKLHISQPTLTRSMQRLEQEFNVSLFVRTQNKISLNENGELAAEQAEKLLSAADDMLSLVHMKDRASHTITIGGCANAPLFQMVQDASRIFSDMIIASKLDDCDNLTAGLKKEEYQLVILPAPVCENDIICEKYGEEHLMFALPSSHPLADRKELYMKDLDGENMLLLSDIGFWHELPVNKMPNSKFLVQSERYAFYELIQSSVLPNFTSDIMVAQFGIPEGRVIIPIKDPEANVTYYATCLEKYRKKYQYLLNNKPGN